MAVEYQVIILFVATRKYLLDVPVADRSCNLFHRLDLSGTTYSRNGQTCVDGWSETGVM